MLIYGLLRFIFGPSLKETSILLQTETTTMTIQRTLGQILLPEFLRILAGRYLFSLLLGQELTILIFGVLYRLLNYLQVEIRQSFRTMTILETKLLLKRH